MSELTLKNIFKLSVLSLVVTGCASPSPLPSNYLTPAGVESAQVTNGRWVKPRIIPLSPQMLENPANACLVEPLMHPKPYLVGAYDNLNIIVWGHPEISTVSSVPIPSLGAAGTYAVSNTANPAIIVQPDGTIFFPYVGHMHVAGLTIMEIERKITKRLSEYIRNPQVSVQVSKFRNRNVYVLGEVRSPGIQPITDKPLTLMESLSIGGGIDTNSSDPTHIYIIRGDYRCPTVFWISAKTPQALIIAEHFPLQENDIVYVSSAGLTGLNRFLNQILPPLTTYTIARGFTR